MTGDASEAEKFIAEDFRGIDQRGKPYGKQDELKAIRTAKRSVRAEVTSIHIAFYGEMAVAQVTEKSIGPAPGLRPLSDVLTDVWVKRGGEWLAVSGMDMDIGFENPQSRAQDEAAISALRASNNEALAAHDVEKFSALFDEGAVFVWSDGSTVVGRAALRAEFAERFKDPNLITFIRSTRTVSIAEDGARAIEQGRWTGLMKNGVIGGDYAAHWIHTSRGWKVRGELFVRLYCTGPGCARQ